LPRYSEVSCVAWSSSQDQARCIFGNLCARHVAETSDNQRSGSGIKGVFVFRNGPTARSGRPHHLVSHDQPSDRFGMGGEKWPSRNRTTNAGGLVPYYCACMGNRYGVRLMTDHSINWRLCRIKDVPKVNTKTSKLHSDIHTCTRLVPKCYLIPPSPSIPRAIHSRKRSHR
jgi:hypothetical protein